MARWPASLHSRNISPPDYDTMELPSKKEILLAQQSTVNKYEQYQKISATACQEAPPQKVDADGMRVMNAKRDRKDAIQKHNDKSHVRSPNFQVGDYVLFTEQRKSGMSKLQVKWKGPRRVASMESDYVFVVENLLTKELKAEHATRMRFYHDKELHVTKELDQATDHNDHQLFVVSKILNARYNEQEIFHEL
jgi:hypothetical protein